MASPTQVKILPITDAQHDYAKEVEEKLHKIGIRVVLDDRNEKVGYKIREAQLEKVPYMLVIGAKEVEEIQFLFVQEKMLKMKL